MNVWSSPSGDRSATRQLIESHETVSTYHAHRAAEKGLKALQIQRTGDHDRTHDLVRLYHELEVPTRFRSVLEDLNPADTAARYPDADEVDLEQPAETLYDVEAPIEWIRTRSNE